MTRIERTIKNVKVNALVFLLSVVVTFITRKIFIDYLGDDLVGLSSMMVSILSFFILADLGIAGAAHYALYKPIFDDDRTQINTLMSVFDYMYKKVGRIVLISALVFSLALVFIFKSSNVELGFVYASFFVFLFSAMLGYMVNYKQMILIANQRNYITVSYLNLCNLAKFSIQATCLAYTSCGYLLWLFWEIVFATLNSILLRRKIRKDYPWLQSNATVGKEYYKKFPAIATRAKQIFSHGFASLLQTQSSTLLIYAFTTLSWVTIYANYILITGKLTQFIYMIFSNSNATVGNLIAEDNHQKTYSVFWQWVTLHYLLGFTIIFALYRLTNPFITLWIGEEYLVNNTQFILILLTVFLTIVRNPLDSYIAGYGLFKDTWSSWTAAALNVTIAIVGGKLWGLSGILLGTAVATFLVIMVWKPYFLFSNGFHRSVSNYYAKLSVIIVGGIMLIFGLNMLFDTILDPNITNFAQWTLQAIITSVSMMLAYLIYLLITTNSMRELMKIAHNMLTNLTTAKK